MLLNQGIRNLQRSDPAAPGPINAGGQCFTYRHAGARRYLNERCNSLMSSTILANCRPNSVKWYSTRGGTSACCTRDRMPKRTSTRKRSLRTLVDRPYTARCIAPGRRTPPCTSCSTWIYHLHASTFSIITPTLGAWSVSSIDPFFSCKFIILYRPVPT